ncbi:hypothetical protein CCMSSC00406_0009099 [Pleurotus cornucopiae]|uniref:Uncharacterized protein n=1 Tax=Pleurotus cornucopiae TaxID=5321 RepID=A0ACB7J5Y4_PLECO|nr:hypothetical protein CCMSSC00406_0009099 [Pleurotus cornucopiae]
MRSHHEFRNWQPDPEKLAEFGASESVLNRDLEVSFAPRGRQPGEIPFKLRERGAGLLAVVDVLARVQDYKPMNRPTVKFRDMKATLFEDPHTPHAQVALKPGNDVDSATESDSEEDSCESGTESDMGDYLMSVPSDVITAGAEVDLDLPELRDLLVDDGPINREPRVLEAPLQLDTNGAVIWSFN